MKAVIEAIMYLKMNLVMPCQIRTDYLVKCKQNWGLRYSICERSKDFQYENEDSYNPEEY